ncbi:MAG TPA: hypothetical protein VFV42_12970, partial [Acidimicrobiales bacterium]|nr:hypothetical protein [Acidimicrobiales bacterium]
TMTCADDRPPFTDSRGWLLLDPRLLHGLELRYVLTDLIASAPDHVWTVAELVRRLERAGFVLPGRASKTVSDHLRAECGRGRVRRVGRGRYALGAIPGATRRRIRRAARHRSELLGSWSPAQVAGSLER